MTVEKLTVEKLTVEVQVILMKRDVFTFFAHIETLEEVVPGDLTSGQVVQEVVFELLHVRECMYTESAEEGHCQRIMYWVLVDKLAVPCSRNSRSWIQVVCLVQHEVLKLVVLFNLFIGLRVKITLETFEEHVCSFTSVLQCCVNKLWLHADLQTLVISAFLAIGPRNDI